MKRKFSENVLCTFLCLFMNALYLPLLQLCMWVKRTVEVVTAGSPMMPLCWLSPKLCQQVCSGVLSTYQPCAARKGLQEDTLTEAGAAATDIVYDSTGSSYSFELVSVCLAFRQSPFLYLCQCLFLVSCVFTLLFFRLFFCLQISV